MAASATIMVNSPQFSRVLEQMKRTNGAKVKNGIKKTTDLPIPTPSIEVTCFDDDTYNKNIQKKLEDPNWKEAEGTFTTPSKVAANDTVAAKQNGEEECVCSDHSSSDDDAFHTNAISSGDENAVVKSGRHASKKSKSARKGSNRNAISSKVTNRKITSTKEKNNDVINKESAMADVADQFKAGVPKAAGRQSLNGSCDSQRSDVVTRPSSARRRFTVCSFPNENDSNVHQSNSELNNRKASAPGISIQNGRSLTGDKKPPSYEIMNNRKKTERIDLSFKVDSTTSSVQSNQLKNSTTSSAQSNQFKKRASTFGPDRTERNGHTSDENLSSGEGLRMHDVDRRTNNGSSTATVASPPKSSEEAFFRPRRISDNSISFLKDAGVIPKRSPSPRRRISTPIMQGANSTSLDIRENRRPLGRSQSDLKSETNSIIKASSDLDSPLQRCKLSAPKPPSGVKPTQLGVGVSPSLSKSETDLRKLVSQEEDAGEKRGLSMCTPPRTRKLGEVKTGSSLGVSGRPSFSKSETDLRKLILKEEGRDMSLCSPSAQSPRLRRSSTSRQQPSSETGAGPCPLSPREERKIYLAAAKTEARLPIRAKNRNDLQASSQLIIDQAEKELDKLSDRLPHISMDEVMKTWQTDRRHWNMVSTVVNPHGEENASKTNMEAMKDCRYIRESVVTTRKKKKSA